jgi:hypothetical protein
MKEDKTLVVDITLGRGLVALLALVVLPLAIVAWSVWGGRDARAAGPSRVSASGARQFYLTPVFYSPAVALSACAAGYHMASLWEVLEPSALSYNTSLGATRADSGQGVPSYKRLDPHRLRRRHLRHRRREQLQRLDQQLRQPLRHLRRPADQLDHRAVDPRLAGRHRSVQHPPPARLVRGELRPCPAG